MLVQTTVARTPASNRLIQSWAQLYLPEVHLAEIDRHPSFYAELVDAASPSGRAATVAKLDRYLLELRCEVSSIQTSSLYTYMQKVMDLREVKRLSAASFQVYSTLLELYAQNAMATLPLNHDWTANLTKTPNSVWGIPDVEALATALEPRLLEFQRQHERSPDWRALGFLTTQLNFCNQWLLSAVGPSEALLLRPYFAFVEEQVAHPWWRVCAAAAQYPAESPVLALAERLIPRSQQIAEAAYAALIQQLPWHRSRRGPLTQPDIAHSCIRDLKMFQAYLWLCVFQESLVSVEQELLNLCIRVLPSVGVKWELTLIWTQALADELLRCLSPIEQSHLQPYTTAMHQVFLKAQAHFDTPLARSIG